MKGPRPGNTYLFSNNLENCAFILDTHLSSSYKAQSFGITSYTEQGLVNNGWQRNALQSAFLADIHGYNLTHSERERYSSSVLREVSSSDICGQVVFSKYCWEVECWLPVSQVTLLSCDHVVMWSFRKESERKRVRGGCFFVLMGQHQCSGLKA